MAIYTVQQPPEDRNQRADRGDAVLVKEGFSWPALFVPTLWCIYHRQWLVLLFLYAALIVLVLLGGGIPAGGLFVLYVLGRFYVALEANGLRRWTLERNGHRLVGLVEGRTLQDAERRYFADAPAQTAVPEAAAVVTRAAAPLPAQTAPARPGGIVGMFPAPEARR